MTDPRALHERARAHVAAREWSAAGDAFAALAAALGALGNPAGRLQALEGAGECWRRADRPVQAAWALRAVLAEAPGGLARVGLAGIYADLGEGGLAEGACRRVLAESAEIGVRAVATDLLIGVLEAAGRKEEARRLLLDLPSDDPRRGAARAFREAQIARLDGRFADARRWLATVRAALEGVDGAQGGLAAARGEQAEIDLLEGASAPAIAHFEEAAAGHLAEGRVAMRWRAECGRVRACAEAGVALLGPDLGEGIAWAEARGFRPLAIDLRIARGMARAAGDPAGAASDLDAAAQDADTLGLPIRAGRARLERATRLPAFGRSTRALLERAVIDLADHVPLARRARLALERLGAGGA